MSYRKGTIAITVLLLGVYASAASLTDFEPAGFVPGESVHNHETDGTDAPPEITGVNPGKQAWSVRKPGTDEEVVDISGSDAAHGKVWRLSDLADTGNLQTRPHAPNSGEQSGETGAIDDFGGDSVTTSSYYAQFDFKSATGGAQPGLEINASGACGDDCRHGFVRIIDDGAGFDLGFYDTGDNSGSLSCGSFVFTPIDLNLSYGDWHTVGIEIQFNDGFGPGGFGVEGNDVVNIYVDGGLVHTGTSWETCYAYVGSGDPRSIDRLTFYRNSSGMSDVGGGLYFDNVLVTDVNPNPPGPPACLTVADVQDCTVTPAEFEDDGLLVVHYNAGTTMATAGPANISFVEIRDAQFATSPILPDPYNYAMNVILPAPGFDGSNLPPALTSLDLATGGVGEPPFGGMPAMWTVDYYNGANSPGNLVGSRAHTVLFGSVCDVTQTFDPNNDGTNPPGTFEDQQLSKTLFRVDDETYHSVNNPEYPLSAAGVESFFLGVSDLTEVGFSTDPGLLTGSSETFVNVWRVSNCATNTLSAIAHNRLGLDIVEPKRCYKEDDMLMVNVSMSCLEQITTGFQAFLDFDEALLEYQGATSSYTTDPFELHIQGIDVAEISPGAINIDGSDDFNDSGTDQDSLLATLKFKVLPGNDGSTASVDFRTVPQFQTELSVDGVGIPTFLAPSTSFGIDQTDPIITCPADIMVDNDANECGALVDPGMPTATDACGVESIVGVRSDALALDESYPSGCSATAPDDGVTVITWTATDCAGNTASCMQTITVTDATPPTATQGTLDPWYPTAGTAEAAAIAATTDLADNCSDAGDLTVTADTVGTCNAIVTVTVTDECGNSADFNYATVIDNAAPVLNCPLAPSGGLIISEIVDGTWPSGLPKFVELANCSELPIDLSNYSLGNINNGAFTMGFDATVLSGILTPGDAHVVAFENGDSPSNGTFFDIYGFDPDDFTPGSFINGDDVLALFSGAALAGDAADGNGAPVVDKYGVVGVDGTGEIWDYEDGYSFRKPFVGIGNGGTFAAAEWTFGGADSLETGNDVTEEALMLSLTTPGTHQCGGGEIVVDTDPGLCAAEVTLTVTATDDCDGPVPVTYQADLGSGLEPITNPYSFPVGTWMVEATAVDACGHSSSCDFTVTVVDDESPTGTMGTINDCYPTNAAAEAAAIAATTDLTDNCTSPGNLLVTAETDGDCDAIVTVTVTDEAGNKAYFDYMTKIDGTPPEMTCPTFGGGNLIISEVVDATLGGGLPKYVELTNCSDSPVNLSGYSIGNYNNGGTSLGGGSSTVLSGILAAGDSYIISYENSDGPGSSVFFDTYGFDPDNFDLGAFTNGDDVIALFLANGTGPGGAATGTGADATLIDVYGVIGVDGTGEVWDYVDGYAYRLPNSLATATFDDSQWVFSGADGLETGDDVTELALILAETTPGTHSCSTTLVVKADAGGCDAVVTFPTPTATDNCDPAPVVVCTPSSGSVFPAGTTPVECVATDDCGNATTCGFDVEVEPVNEVDVEVELVGVMNDALPLSRCIHFVTDDCSQSTDVELTFTDHDSNAATPLRAAATIEVPCGNWTQLCAKDEQHTLFNTTTLTDAGTYYTADTLISLRGGDTDNDSDVDINDVTWLLATFGNSPSYGGCPWDGSTRDADFSNNGNVGSEDYTFLTANWLTITSCACTLPRPGGLQAPVEIVATRSSVRTSALPANVVQKADLNRDGIVDYKDVRMFEIQHGLTGALSTKIRATEQKEISLGNTTEVQKSK